MRALAALAVLAAVHSASPRLRPEPLGEPTRNVDAGTLLVGTLWCGKGHLLWHHNVVDGREIMGTNARSFGELSTVAPHLDSCCRMHDYCPWYADEGDSHGRCASDEHVSAWRRLVEQTLRMDLQDQRWGEVAAPFVGSDGLPGFVPYEQCGRIEDRPALNHEVFASACECDRAFLQCVNSAARIEDEYHPANFIREVYFHTAIAVAVPLGPLSRLLETNVDRNCIERQDDGTFLRDLRTDRFGCLCKGACGAGAGEAKAWCYTEGDCGAPAMLGNWDFCDKFCFDSPTACRGYKEQWVYLQ